MEIIRIPGYMDIEKLQISRKHLLPKQIERHGLNTEQLSISDKTLVKLINGYTREAGVRSMERELAKVCRKVAKEVIDKGSQHKARITERNLSKYLGVVRFKDTRTEKEDIVGLTTGLAWTEVGGEVLTTEVLVMPGKGRLTLTGKLGDVMKESASAAMSYVKTRAQHFGIDIDAFEKNDIHIHLPEGAIPKDGPSAGITLATSILSALTRTPVRADIAMTGEITLRGRVLAIGGLKEKLLAAHRYDIKTVCIPKDNEKDLIDVPTIIKKSLEIIPVEHVDDVLNAALVWAKREKPPVKDLPVEDSSPEVGTGQVL